MGQMRKRLTNVRVVRRRVSELTREPDLHLQPFFTLDVERKVPRRFASHDGARELEAASPRVLDVHDGVLGVQLGQGAHPPLLQRRQLSREHSHREAGFSRHVAHNALSHDFSAHTASLFCD